MRFNGVNNKECLRSPGGQRCRHICACVGIPYACGLLHSVTWPLHFIEWQLIAQAVLLPPPFRCFYSVTGACSSCCVGAHGLVARVCQPWEQSYSSRSWLPIVEAPGCFRHPTSILAMQFLITTIHKIMQGTKLMTTDNTWSKAWQSAHVLMDNLN